MRRRYDVVCRVGSVLKYYASLTKVLKLKFRMFVGLTSTLLEVTGKKTGRIGEGFLLPHPE